jgi:hypothetical protein
VVPKILDLDGTRGPIGGVRQSDGARRPAIAEATSTEFGPISVAHRKYLPDDNWIGHTTISMYLRTPQSIYFFKKTHPFVIATKKMQKSEFPDY